MNIFALICMAQAGILDLAAAEASALLTGIAAPVVVAGVVWYTISFAGIPEKFLGASMALTSIVLLAFLLSLTALFSVLATIVPWPVAVIVVIPIYLALYVAAVCHDNLDGLKVAAGQGAPTQSRSVQRYKSVHRLEKAVEQDELVNAVERVDARANLFVHFCEMLARNLTSLEARQPPAIANHLIADSLDLLYRLMKLSDRPIEADEGYSDLVTRAHVMTVDDVNHRTVHYLRIATEGLQAQLGATVTEEMSDVATKLSAIDRLRAPVETSDDGDVPAIHSRQELADFLFIHVFRQLVSIARSHQAMLLQRDLEPLVVAS